jgi:hypothetical protein
MMMWDDHESPEEATIRARFLPDEHPLAAARGCVYALLFAIPCWALLAAGLLAFGWLVAGIRFP